MGGGLGGGLGGLGGGLGGPLGLFGGLGGLGGLGGGLGGLGGGLGGLGGGLGGLGGGLGSLLPLLAIIQQDPRRLRAIPQLQLQRALLDLKNPNNFKELRKLGINRRLSRKIQKDLKEVLEGIEKNPPTKAPAAIQITKNTESSVAKSAEIEHI